MFAGTWMRVPNSGTSNVRQSVGLWSRICAYASARSSEMSAIITPGRNCRRIDNHRCELPWKIINTHPDGSFRPAKALRPKILDVPSMAGVSSGLQQLERSADNRPMLALWPALARAPTVCACAPSSELEWCRKSGRRSAASGNPRNTQSAPSFDAALVLVSDEAASPALDEYVRLHLLGSIPPTFRTYRSCALR